MNGIRVATMGTNGVYGAASEKTNAGSKERVVVDGDAAPPMTTADGKLPPYNDWPLDQGFENTPEQPTPTPLKVTGKIPAYAAGTLYRTGPGQRHVTTAAGNTLSLDHWFDGYTTVHRFQIGTDNTVTYNSRHTVDSLVEKVRRTGKLDGMSFGGKRDPCEGYFKKITSVFLAQKPFPGPKYANVGVTLTPNHPGLPGPMKAGRHGSPAKEGIKTVHLKTDSYDLKAIDPETLEPLGLVDQSTLHPLLSGPLSAAHAKSDPETGDVFNYNLALGRTPTYRVFKVGAATGKTEILATITSAKAAYLHSLFLTEHFVVLCVWNSHYTLNGLGILWRRNIVDALSPLSPDLPARWFVIDRYHGHGVVAEFTSPAFFSFHTINAYEAAAAADDDDGAGGVHVFAELAQYEDLSVIHRCYYENLLSTSPAAHAFQARNGSKARAQIVRWKLPHVPLPAPSTDAATKHPSSSAPKRGVAQQVLRVPKPSSVELPTLNPRYITREHRYVYGVSDTGRSTFFDGLLKLDTRTGETVAWQHRGQNPGEPIFVADPEAGEEDGGCLLSVVLDGVRGGSYLLCLDARTMGEVGRAEVGAPVGYGFHGCHVGLKGEGVGRFSFSWGGQGRGAGGGSFRDVWTQQY